jgi:hypothetical protein
MPTTTPLRERADRDLMLALIVVASVMAFRTVVDQDLPGHLAFGLVHLETGRLQTTDPYSYTAAGAPWINHEWVFELLIARVYTWGGVDGLLALQGLAWLGTGAVVVLLLRRGTRDLLPTVLLFCLYVAQSYPSISVRPQLVTFLCFALMLLVLERARTRSPDAGPAWKLLSLPPLIALWTNCHGGFLAGLGVLGAYTAGLVVDALLARPVHGPGGDAPLPRRTAALAAGATLLAAAGTLVNPYGADLHRWLAWSLGVPNPNISEWQPIALDAQGATFVVTLLLVLAALVARGPRRLPLAHVVVLAVTGVMALRHTRHVPFFLIEACAFAAGPSSDLYRRVAARPVVDLTPAELRRVRAMAVALVVLGLALRFGASDVRLKLRADAAGRWPTGAIEHVDALLRERQAAGEPPLRAIVYFDWAQLAIWRWHPHLRVHYDGRHRTVYGLDVEEEHFAFLTSEPDPPPTWRRALTAWPTEAVLVRSATAVDRRMRAEPGWRVAYEDPVATLFLRLDGGGATPPPVVGPATSPVIPFETRLGG